MIKVFTTSILVTLLTTAAFAQQAPKSLDDYIKHRRKNQPHSAEPVKPSTPLANPNTHLLDSLYNSSNSDTSRAQALSELKIKLSPEEMKKVYLELYGLDPWATNQVPEQEEFNIFSSRKEQNAKIEKLAAGRAFVLSKSPKGLMQGDYFYTGYSKILGHPVPAPRRSAIMVIPSANSQIWSIGNDDPRFGKGHCGGIGYCQNALSTLIQFKKGPRDSDEQIHDKIASAIRLGQSSTIQGFESLDDFVTDMMKTWQDQKNPLLRVVQEIQNALVHPFEKGKLDENEQQIDSFLAVDDAAEASEYFAKDNRRLQSKEFMQQVMKTLREQGPLHAGIKFDAGEGGGFKSASHQLTIVGYEIESGNDETPTALFVLDTNHPNEIGRLELDKKSAGFIYAEPPFRQKINFGAETLNFGPPTPIWLLTVTKSIGNRARSLNQVQLHQYDSPMDKNIPVPKRGEQPSSSLDSPLSCFAMDTQKIFGFPQAE